MERAKFLKIGQPEKLETPINAIIMKAIYKNDFLLEMKEMRTI